MSGLDLAVTISGLVLILLAPLAVLAAVFLWQIYREDWRSRPVGIVRLSLVLAVTSTIAAIAGSYLAVVSAFRILGRFDIVLAVTPFTLVALIALDLIPVLNAGYLLWLRRRRRSSEGAVRPPPWSRDD